MFHMILFGVLYSLLSSMFLHFFPVVYLRLSLPTGPPLRSVCSSLRSLTGGLSSRFVDAGSKDPARPFGGGGSPALLSEFCRLEIKNDQK